MMEQFAFAYIRRSSYKQLENNSIETQKIRILEFAERKGLTIPEDFIFIEDVTSAYSKKARQRKALMKLMGRMIESNINTVIFNEESRMDRTGFSFVVDFYRPLYYHFGEVNIFTTDSDEVWTPDSQHVKIAFLLYREESTIKSERAIGDLKARLQSNEGMRPGSKVPYGYSQLKNKLIPDSQSEIVSLMYYLHSWGYSMKQIADCLNSANIPSATNGQWAVSSVESILKNEVYLGDLKWNIKKGKEPETITFPSSHEPIVSDTLLAFIQMNHHLQKTYGRLNTPFLLLNKVVCGNCQQPLICKNSSTRCEDKHYKYQYYICSHCSYKWPADDLHEVVYKELTRYIEQLISADEQMQMVRQAIQQHQECIEHQISELENKLDILFSKEEVAAIHSDQRLLDLITQKTEELIEEREKLYSTQDLLITMQDAVEDESLINRFSLISNQQLKDQEIRLLVLYFIESVTVSPVSTPAVTFTSDMMRDLFKSI